MEHLRKEEIWKGKKNTNELSTRFTVGKTASRTLKCNTNLGRTFLFSRPRGLPTKKVWIFYAHSLAHRCIPFLVSCACVRTNLDLKNEAKPMFQRCKSSLHHNSWSKKLARWCCCSNAADRTIPVHLYLEYISTTRHSTICITYLDDHAMVPVATMYVRTCVQYARMSDLQVAKSCIQL